MKFYFSNYETTGHLVPDTSGVYDLGSESKPFRHLYIQPGTIKFVRAPGASTDLSVTADGSLSLPENITGKVAKFSKLMIFPNQEITLKRPLKK